MAQGQSASGLTARSRKGGARGSATTATLRFSDRRSLQKAGGSPTGGRWAKCEMGEKIEIDLSLSRRNEREQKE